MANVSAKRNVKAQNPMPQRSPHRRPEAIVLSVPLRRGLRPMYKSGISAGFGFANCASFLAVVPAKSSSNQFDISKFPSNTSYPSDGSRALPVPEPVILMPLKRPVPSALTIFDENRLP